MKKLTPSTENYLEIMYLIDRSGEEIRVKDISSRLHVSMPSVNAAVRNLAARDFVMSEPYGSIQLTEKGRSAAAAVYRKHTILKDFLQKILAIPEAIAGEEACQLEHYISAQTVQRLELFTELFMSERTADSESWESRFCRVCQAKGLDDTSWSAVNSAAHPNLNIPPESTGSPAGD